MNRRQLLAQTGVAAALAGCARPPANSAGPAAAPARHASARPGVVVSVHLPGVFAARGAQRVALLEKMVAAGLAQLTGASGADAWRHFFQPDDRVGLKLNCIASGCSTRPELTQVVAAGILSAGVPGEHVIAWDRSERELRGAGYTVGAHPSGFRVHGTDSDGFGYSRESHAFGGVSQRLSSFVTTHCTALVNLPVTKDHSICGTTGALKNHYGTIHRPMLCHSHKGDPAVADVASLAPIRERERLVISDALTVVYEGGPSFRPDRCEVADTLLFATDPVAHDMVAWQLIDAARSAKGLKPLAQCGRAPSYLQTAAAAPRSLGHADLNEIKLHKLELT